MSADESAAHIFRKERHESGTHKNHERTKALKEPNLAVKPELGQIFPVWISGRSDVKLLQFVGDRLSDRVYESFLSILIRKNATFP